MFHSHPALNFLVLFSAVVVHFRVLWGEDLFFFVWDLGCERKNEKRSEKFLMLIAEKGRNKFHCSEVSAMVRNFYALHFFSVEILSPFVGSAHTLH